jgi:hypothetical protein
MHVFDIQADGLAMELFQIWSLETQYLKQSHGRAIGLDIKDTHAPLLLLFLIHEYMVCRKDFTNERQTWR